MHGLAFLIATTMGATSADNTFLLCTSCQQPADFAKVVTAKAYSRTGAFRDLVGNPDTGTIYVVEYVVKEGSPSAEVTLERRANEVAEQQFRELVDETTRSKALLERH